MTADQIRDRTRRRARHAATVPPPTPEADEPVQTAPDDEANAIRSREAAIDAALDMTFPASDPPAWTP